jgi:arginine/serine-rich splicing factor 17
LKLAVLDSLPPTERLELENGLTLVPRVKLSFTVYPTSPSVTKPVDEWKVKLTDLALHLRHRPPEEDLEIQPLGDLKKRKREDPVAQGSLFISDLGFLNQFTRKNNAEEEEEDVKVLEEKFLDWRKHTVDKMDGMELNLEGFK